jgi:hypothetical protein
VTLPGAGVPAALGVLEEEAAMPMDKAELASLRQANERYAADYDRRLAAEIVAMLPRARDEAALVLRFAHAILDLELPTPEGRRNV